MAASTSVIQQNILAHYGSCANAGNYLALMPAIESEQRIKHELKALAEDCIETKKVIDEGSWTSMFSWGESAEQTKLNTLTTDRVRLHGELGAAQEKIRKICSEILKPSAGSKSSVDTRLIDLFVLIITLELSNSIDRNEFEKHLIQHCNKTSYIDSRNPFIKLCLEKLRRLPAELTEDEIALQKERSVEFGRRLWTASLVVNIRATYALSQAAPLIHKAIERLSIQQEDSSSTETVLSKSLATIIKDTYGDMLDEYELLPIISESDRNTRRPVFTEAADIEICCQINENRERLEQKLVGADARCTSSEMAKLIEMKRENQGNSLLPKTIQLMFDIVAAVPVKRDHDDVSRAAIVEETSPGAIVDNDDLYIAAIVDATSICAKEIGAVIKANTSTSKR